jgi:hypothetical protein
MEHYWPPALLHAAHQDESLRAWLTGDAFPPYEVLPPALQSRWIDGSETVSRLRKLAWLTGLAVPAALARVLTAPAARRAGMAV